MKHFFDDFNWEWATATVLSSMVGVLFVISVIWAIASDSLWPFLLWVPMILLGAICVGKGWWADDETR